MGKASTTTPSELGKWHMKYLTFHAVNALLLIGVLGTILLWVIWTPSVSGPPTDQERSVVNLRDSEQPDQSAMTTTTRNPNDVSPGR